MVSFKKLSSHLVYLVFDILMILAELFLFEKLVANWETLWNGTYFWVFLFFCLGIFLKWWDPEYLKGIDTFGQKYTIVSVISIYFFGLGLGGFALFSFAGIFFKGVPPIYIAIPAALIFVFGYPVLFGFISKTKTPDTKKLPVIIVFLLQMVSYAALFFMNIYMLSFAYYQLEKFRAHTVIPLWTYPFVILIVALLIILFYLPARIHLFFQAADKKGNYISFIITCAGLALFAVTGIYLRF
ncbi:MAG: hypothetical protein JXB88_06845 [Spirochaetales bacterium]|nr:hypothetical protein [Spirochaetales bacterium]